MKLFVSTSVYALAHQLGMRGAIEEVKRQLDAPGKDSLPVVRTMARLRQLRGDFGLLVDGGATYIGMARSRAFHEAFKSDADVWLSLDDDIEATTDVCSALLEAVDDIVPRIVLVPYLKRDDSDGPQLTVTLPMVRSERHVQGATLVRMSKGLGGFPFGMVALNRTAMREIVSSAPPELQWFDYGEPKLALFYEKLEDGFWHGEDTSFFRYSVPDVVSVECLTGLGTVLHAGFPLQLASL
jgi:hypothetical protein